MQYSLCIVIDEILPVVASLAMHGALPPPLDDPPEGDPWRPLGALGRGWPTNPFGLTVDGSNDLLLRKSGRLGLTRLTEGDIAGNARAQPPPFCVSLNGVVAHPEGMQCTAHAPSGPPSMAGVAPHGGPLSQSQRTRSAKRRTPGRPRGPSSAFR